MGQTFLVRSQRLRQCAWKAWLQAPQATMQASSSSRLPDWQSTHLDMSRLRQIAHTSTSTFHDQTTGKYQ